MPVNPNRLSTRKSVNKHRRVNPRLGIKRSDIRKKNGYGMNPSFLGGKDTKTGYVKEVTDNKKFKQYYEIIYAGNAKEFGYSTKGTRVIHVLRGHLYITLGDIVEEVGPEGEKSEVVRNKQVEQLAEGNYLEIQPGTAYALAATGTYHTELLVTETLDYVRNWKRVEDALVTRQQAEITAKTDAPRSRRRDPSESNVKVAAEATARAKGRGKYNQKNVQANQAGRVDNQKTHYSNANSSTVVGVNPQPVIPSSDE